MKSIVIIVFFVFVIASITHAAPRLTNDPLILDQVIDLGLALEERDNVERRELCIRFNLSVENQDSIFKSLDFDQKRSIALEDKAVRYIRKFCDNVQTDYKLYVKLITKRPQSVVNN